MNRSEKERKFVELLKVRNANIPGLVTRMKIAIYMCYGIWIILPAASILIYFVEGPPKLYQVLALLAIVFVSAAIFLHCKNVLRIIEDNNLRQA
jgi:hypothetical protein